jgi:hypothetical protein
MAEVLGLIASGATFAQIAIQIGSSILQLKQLWERVKNAGKDIEHLMEEVEHLGLVLQNVEQTVDGITDPLLREAPEKCLCLCRQALSLLSREVTDLGDVVSRRRWIGGARAPLRARRVGQLKDRLRTAQSLLMFSYQIYSE